MILHVIDRNYNALTTIDTNAQRGTKLSDIKISPAITNGTKLNTLDATVIKDDEDSELVDIGKYLAWTDGNGQANCVAITNVPNETSTERPVEAEDLGMELINGSATVFTSSAAQTIEYYVNRELYDSGWAIGDNELGADVKMLVDTSQDETPLARLQRIATAFGCEMTFSLDFQNLKIKQKKVNIYYSIGSDKTDKVFYSGRDVINMQVSKNTDQLITALQDTNNGFTDLNTGDGRYFTRKGESIVYDREANATYGRGNTSEERFSGYITGVYASTHTAQIDNYNEVVAQLQTRNEPAFSATVDLLFNEGDFNVGDWLTFVDEDFRPAMRIKARVMSMELHPDDAGNNKVTIANVQQLRSMISSDLLSLQQQITPDDAVYSLKLSTDNGAGFIEGQDKTTTIKATVTENGTDITSTLGTGDFLWYKVGQDGTHDTDWETANADAGASVTVTDADVNSLASIKCMLLTFTNQYVQAVYFLNGLKAVAKKVLRLQSADTVTSVLISDTHYATDSVARDDLENYGRSVNHAKNVVELSRFIDLDYIVHDGDVHDGSTANKSIAESNFGEMVSTLGLAKCPYFISWGNHDSNSWGDLRTDVVYKVIQNYKPSKPGTTGAHGKGTELISNKEMYAIATQPSTVFDIHENPDDKMGYYYYDVPGKKMRVVMLNAQDIPDVLDTDGYIKYQAINVAGYRQQQVTWLYNTLKSMPADYTVAIYQHYGFGYRYTTNMAYVPYNYELVDGIINSFVLGTKFSGSYTANSDFKASISTDFTGQKGKLAFLAHGHFHRDKLTKDSNGINNYSIGCSVSRPKKEQGDRPLGVLQEDLWDVVVTNTATRHVDLIRFGAGDDRSFDY